MHRSCDLHVWYGNCQGDRERQLRRKLGIRHEGDGGRLVIDALRPPRHRGPWTRVGPRSGANVVVAVASAVGLAAFFYPLLLPSIAATTGGDRTARGEEAPIVLAAVVALCSLAILAELSDATREPVGMGGGFGTAAKTVALLGVLVALDATMRLVPSVAGASPIFALILLVGAVWGATFGFLMGALTLLVSAFLTGGLGPWLPYQMLGAGWVGMAAAWLPRLANPRARLVSIAIYGAVSGLVYGALLNLYSWPFSAPDLQQDVGLYFTPGLSLEDTVSRYARFYVVTSLGHDLFRAAGNALLLLALGGPALRVLERYRERFGWEPWVDEPEVTHRPLANRGTTDVLE